MKRIGILTTGSLVLVLCPVVALAGDGVVALQTADPSCPDSSGNIYVDCGNGTVTDNRTGLVWLANTNCLSGQVDWLTAMQFVAGLSDLPGDDPDDCGLEDGSSPGEWRLPSKAEWQAMVADANALSCSPTITNDSGNDCWDPACVTAGACSFSDVFPSFYWSSTTCASSSPSLAFVELLLFGPTNACSNKTDPDRVWPVRGGQ